MTRIGEVVAVAPRDEQSAVGHAITLRAGIDAAEYKFDGALAEISAVAVGGTPADCAKLALNALLPRRPSLVVSGINRGSNMAVNVMYSGTVSAATETSLQGIDSVAFSLVEGATDEFNYSAAAQYAQVICTKVLRSRLPRGVVLNVNIPPLPFDKIKGILVTRLARSRWKEAFIKRNGSPENSTYWYQGKFINLDVGDDTDIHAVENGYVSISPIQPDRTSFGCLTVLDTWRWPKHAR